MYFQILALNFARLRRSRSLHPGKKLYFRCKNKSEKANYGHTGRATLRPFPELLA